MSEFKLHHLVTELLRTLGSDRNSPEEFVEYLQNNIDSGRAPLGPNLPIQTHVQSLAQSSANPEAFLSKFEDLKQKDVGSLGAYVELMHQISQDLGVKDFLQRTQKMSFPASPLASVNIKKEDLQIVKNKLKEAVAPRFHKFDDDHKLIVKTCDPLPSIPSLTSWFNRRPTMSWDFSSTNLAVLTGPINNIPPSSQEQVLIEDMLNILMGLPGNYIQPKELKNPYDPREFTISDGVDTSLKELLKQILPLAAYYSMAQRFAEEKMQFEFGQVNNALAEAIHNILVEYTLFVTQLETESRASNMNLQKMWFYIQSNLHSMNIINNLVNTINKSDARGGKVLSLLNEKVLGSIGDSKAQNLCIYLMEAASVPYMKMLGMWIYKGVISDPIKEFLIEDNEVVQKEDMPIDYSADYWEKKYTLRRERIPKILEPVADIILRAGKYLNVIRQCGKCLNNEIKKLNYKVEEERCFIEEIQNAYKFASETLLDLILKKQDLLGRLKSVKNYFLLEKGDFIVTFLGMCEKELGKDVQNVNQARLDYLLDLALSTANNDPYRGNLRTELLPYDLQFQMLKILSISTNAEQDFWKGEEKKENLTVINSFSFNYEVQWPLSLILNRKSVACYQMIFRHLFFCKYVERMVCLVWRSNKVAKKFPHGAAGQYRKAFALQQRMLHCIQNLEYHMMVEVVEPHWATFVQRIHKVTNVDEVLSCHNDFLDSCLKDCMLTIPELLGTITKLLTICVDFCKFMQRTQRYFVEAELGSLPNSFYESYNQNEPNIFNNLQKPIVDQIESFEGKITHFDLEFSTALMQLLNQINELNKGTSDHNRLFNLLYRLDFSGFYMDQFDRLKKTYMSG